MMAETRVMGRLPIGLLTVARQRHQHRWGSPGSLQDFASQLLAAHIRHADVGDHHFRLMLGNDLQSGSPIVRGVNLMPQCFEQSPQEMERCTIIVHNHDSSRHLRAISVCSRVAAVIRLWDI